MASGQVDWENLPEELWLSHILKYLPSGALARVTLVSKKLNRLATDPLLWASKHIGLNKRRIVTERPFLSFLNVPRFAKLRTLDLSGQVLSLEFAEALFRYINSTSSQITRMNLSSVNMCCIGFVSCSITRSCSCSEFSHDNSNYLHPNFSFVTENITWTNDKFCLMKISDSYRERELNENLVGRAVAKLEESKLADFMNGNRWGSGSSGRFVAAILRKVKTTSHHQSIDFSWLDFTNVPPALFAEATASLRKAKFFGCKGLTPVHTTALVGYLANQESVSLTSLILIDQALPENPPKELARGISKLKHLHLRSMPGLQLEHVHAILEAVPKSNLQSLDIGVPTVGVPFDVIRAAILHLNPGKNIAIPSGYRTREDRIAVRKLLGGNDVFFW